MKEKSVPKAGNKIVLPVFSHCVQADNRLIRVFVEAPALSYDKLTKIHKVVSEISGARVLYALMYVTENASAYTMVVRVRRGEEHRVKERIRERLEKMKNSGVIKDFKIVSPYKNLILPLSLQEGYKTIDNEEVVLFTKTMLEGMFNRMVEDENFRQAGLMLLESMGEYQGIALSRCIKKSGVSNPGDAVKIALLSLESMGMIRIDEISLTRDNRGVYVRAKLKLLLYDKNDPLELTQAFASLVIGVLRGVAGSFSRKKSIVKVLRTNREGKTVITITMPQ